MRVAITLVLTGCVVGNHPPSDPRVYLERAQREAEAGRPGIALGALFALHAPQLGSEPPVEAQLLEARIYVDQCLDAYAYALVSRLRADHSLTEAQAAEASEIVRLTGVAWFDGVPRLPQIAVDDVIVDGEHHVYPFDGTFWTDELDSYRIAIRSQCERR